MGTKVHCKSYAPVCYPMSNLNKNANSGTWPHYFEDRTLTADRYYGHLLQRQTKDGYSVLDKEELKQAMLKHEIIFRNQVYELHRLYGIQKDIMAKLKRKELNKFQVPIEASQSSPFLSQIPPEDVQNASGITQNLLAISSPSSSNLSNMQSPLNFIKEGSMQINPVPTYNKHSLLDSDLQASTSKKSPTKKYDLQLPADEYLASDETEQIGKEKVTPVNVEADYLYNRYCRNGSENDCIDRGPSCQGDASTLRTDKECKHRLVDLNEPVQVEEASNAAVINSRDLISCHRENQGTNFCPKSSSMFVGLSMEYLQNTWQGRDNRMCKDIQPLENKSTRQELDMCAHQSGSYPGSSSVPSWMKPKRSPCVEPCASLSRSQELFTPSLGFGEKKDQYNTDLRVTSSFGCELPHQNGHFKELQSESNLLQNHLRSVGFDYDDYENNVACGDTENQGAAKYSRLSSCRYVKTTKDIDLNLTLLNGLQVGMTPQQDYVVGNKGNNEDWHRGSPMLRMEQSSNDGTSRRREDPKQMELDFLHGFPQHSACKSGDNKVLSASSIQNSASFGHHSDFQMTGVNRNTVKILGFSVTDKLHVPKNQSSFSSVSNSQQCSSEVVEARDTAKVGNVHTDLSRDLSTFYSDQLLPLSLVVDKRSSGHLSNFANPINSNKCPKEEKVLPQTVIRKISDIDLETLVDLETLEDFSTGEDSFRNQHEKHVHPSQTGKYTQQEIVKTAAEAILILSTSGHHDYTGDSSCLSLEAPQTDPLHWFAGVITSIKDGPENKVSMDDDNLPHGMDYFESMTLKLTEMKVDEYCPETLMSECREELTEASSLMTQRCRGKGRRGGQRRNFQRDILPGFTSLTKHEISEDLEMLEGLMRSMGHSWRIGSARRNAARNGRARGRARQ